MQEVCHIEFTLSYLAEICPIIYAPKKGEPMDASGKHIAELHQQLLEETDKKTRAEVHIELAKIALERKRVDLAIRHYREALLLNPLHETAKQAMLKLGVRAPETKQLKSRIKRLFSRSKEE